MRAAVDVGRRRRVPRPLLRASWRDPARAALPIPILVGGRSDAALARAGRLGDGWLALWISPRRFAEATGHDRGRRRAEAGRGAVRWQHALQLWARFDASPARARQRLSATDEGAYALPFERFARYAPCGPPEAVAEALAPYLAVGCRRFNIVPEAVGLGAAIDAAAEVKTHLSGRGAVARAGAVSA